MAEPTASVPTRLRDRRRICAVINQKGGSTKTTTAVNLSAALVARGAAVRLHDIDPQEGSATFWLPPQSPAGKGLLDVFNDEATLDEATAKTTVDGLYIVPSWKSLREVERSRPAGSEIVLRTALAGSTAPVDFEVLDCPHSMDVLAIGAIAAAEELIIPVQASGLDVVGMSELLELAALIKKRYNPQLSIAAIVVGRTKGNSGFDAKLLESFREQYPTAVVASISDSVQMRQATEAHTPINLYAPNGRASRDFAALAEGVDNWELIA